jgi:multiple sugar transport system ATP-binding protein
LDQLDLDVAAGEVLCLVGPSGCGKSTMLRLLAGLDEPDGGSIEIGGRDMRGVAPRDRDVAMVFQGFALYPHLRVRQILEFPLRMRGVPRAERDEAVRNAASLLGISGLLERRPGELSGGEQQRVAMGRAIVRKPRVFLFDEPLSNLDAKLRSELRVELAKLLRSLKATAVYVTHDQIEAMTIGDHIAVLRAGKLEQLATPRLIYEKPASTFVASFFGTPAMNLLRVAPRDRGRAALGGAELVPPDHASPPLLGVRPEHVRLYERNRLSHEQDLHTVRGTVTAVELLGAESHVTVSVDVQNVCMRLPGFDVPSLGETVELALFSRDLHWFDASSGRAL